MTDGTKILETEARFGRGILWKMRIADLLGRNVCEPVSVSEHLAEAMQWLARSQDASPDDGFARQFHLSEGWKPSYPETTGYIIPTFLDYAAKTGDDLWRDRAIKAARWLVGEQLENGAIYGGPVEADVKKPAIFNTGMVMKGWVRVCEAGEGGAASDGGSVRNALIRAMNLLIESQDEDGAWRKHLSIYARGTEHVYHTRVAWALAMTGKALENEEALRAAERNVAWAMTLRSPNGWYGQNDLVDDNRPLTHTIAYATRGTLETASILGRQDWIDECRVTADALLDVQRSDGAIPGRLSNVWKPAANYVCLTGLAQIALIWIRLHRLTEETRYIAAARRANQYLMSRHDICTSNPGIRGAVKGSYPVQGEYIRDAYPNWAAKFFADSLMQE